MVKTAQSQEMKFVTTLQTRDAWNQSKMCIVVFVLIIDCIVNLFVTFQMVKICLTKLKFFLLEIFIEITILNYS